MNVYIGCDHRGVEIENEITDILTNNGYNVLRTKTKHTPIDAYVDFAIEVSNNVVNDKNSLGILICGTGIGMSIAANKVKGIRAARCTTVEDAQLSREHNGANIICIGMSDINNMIDIIQKFLETNSAIEQRHLDRINKIINYEESAYNEL